MKWSYLVLLFSASILLFSCKAAIITNPTNETIFDFSISDYSESNYLLDSTYSSSFNSYYISGQSNIDISKIEVWVYAEANNPQKRLCRALTNITARPDSGYRYRQMADSDGVVLISNFIKLDQSEYTLNRYAGYITLNNYTATMGKDAIAVSYTITQYTGQEQFGDYVNDMLADSLLSLKLIRTRAQQPPFENPNHAELWNRMLKNIYNLGVKNIQNDPNKFLLKIVKRPTSSTSLEVYIGDQHNINYATNKSYLTLTKMDLRRGVSHDTNWATGGGPDGAFDFLPGKTIDLTNGNIIFPDLKPFSQTLIQRGVQADSIGLNDDIYNKSKTVTANEPIYFYISGSIK
jgi:hypothetical protein